MKWEGQEQSDNVEDRRGMRPAVAMGGGALGVIVVIIGLIFGVDLRGLVGNNPGGPGGAAVQQGEAPPDDQAKEFSATILRFTEKVWEKQFEQNGMRYEKPKMVLFMNKVDTACGTAPSAVGPFYCPGDHTVYLDPTFFDELQRELGGSKADFSKAYVIAHEVGHHVQNLTGYNEKVRQFERREGKNATIRLELQADYLAGVWAHHGQKQFNFIEDGDVDSALKTANAIGDDRLQKRAQGWASPESFTHGSSAQRIKAFREGLRTGEFNKQRLEYYFNPKTNPLEL